MTSYSWSEWDDDDYGDDSRSGTDSDPATDSDIEFGSDGEDVPAREPTVDEERRRKVEAELDQVDWDSIDED